MKRSVTPQQVVWLGLALVALVILVMRWDRTGSRLMQAPQAVSLLDTAMSASAGEAVSMAELARLGANQERVTGVSARALARLALLSGQPEVAERWLREGAATDDIPNLTLFELCRFYWNRGEIERALTSCANSRSSAAYWLDLGYDMANSGVNVAAINLFAMAAATDPSLSEAWHQLGRAYFADQRLDDAIQALQQQLAIDPDATVDVYRTLGEAYLETGDAVSARDVLEDGLVRFPNDKLLSVMRAAALGETGELALADGQYAQLADLYPHDPAIWAGWSDVAVASGDERAASQYIQEALRLAPDNVGYWLDMVEVSRAASDIPSIARAYRELMMLRPEDVGLWLDAGRFWLESGQLQEARFVLDRVIQLDPENEDAARLRQILLESTVTIEDSAAQQP